MEIIKNGFVNERLGVELDVYVIEGKEWFKDSDIANFLEYRDSYNMKRVIDFLSENSIPRITTNGYEAHYIDHIGFSKIIQKSRKIDKTVKLEILNSLGITPISCLETEFGRVLKEAFDEIDITMIPQFYVDGYRVDFYLPKLNIIIEYDEKQHFKSVNEKKDRERQRQVENKICAKFIRCDYRDSNIKNLMKVLKEVM